MQYVVLYIYSYVCGVIVMKNKYSVYVFIFNMLYNAKLCV